MSSLAAQPKRPSTPTLPTGLSGEEELRPTKEILRLEKLEVELENVEELDTVQKAADMKRKQSRNAKSRKKQSPPLPDPCSEPDVLYQEIRQLLRPSVLDVVTEGGEAFTSPYKTSDEVLVRIEVVGTGGSGIGRVSETDAWAIVLPQSIAWRVGPSSHCAMGKGLFSCPGRRRRRAVPSERRITHRLSLFLKMWRMPIPGAYLDWTRLLS